MSVNKEGIWEMDPEVNQLEPSLNTDSLNYMNNDLIKSFSFSGSANS